MPVTHPPRSDDRDLFEQLFRNRSKGLSGDQITYLVDLALDPDATLTAKGIARDLGVSKPTGQRYRDLIVSARERGPQAVLSGTGTDTDKPTPETKRRAQRQAVKEGAKIRRKLQEEQERLSADDMSLLVDRWIRRLDADPNASATQMKQLLEFKAKFEDVANTGQELIIDPMKQLGRDGIAGVAKRFVQHIEILSHHRFEVAEAWTGLAEIILRTLTDDLNAEERLPDWTPHDRLRELLFSLETTSAELAGSTDTDESGESDPDSPQEDADGPEVG